MTGAMFEKMVLSLPNTGLKPHFERIGYFVVGRRMFTTYLAKDNTANIFLSPEEQAVFCKMDPKNIYPVPNKWGDKGMTIFKLKDVDRDFVQEALVSAYHAVVTKK